MGGAGVTIFSEIVPKWEADSPGAWVDASATRMARLVPFSFFSLGNYNRQSPLSRASVDARQARPGGCMVPGEAGPGQTQVASPILYSVSYAIFCIPGRAVRNMKKLVHVALAVLFLLGIASAQNIPAVDVFAGYSYLKFDLPASPNTGASSQRLNLNGGEVSFSVHVWHRLAFEADFSDHYSNDCENTGYNCSNFSFMFGPRFNFGNRSRRITYFAHGLFGKDRTTLPYSLIPGVSNNINQAGTLADTSVVLDGGAGLNYWAFRHIGFQAQGDYDYTHHWNNYDLPSQNSFRASAGIAFRFGGNLPASEPSRRSKSESSSRRHPSKSRPVPAENQPSTVAAGQPAQTLVGVPGHGMQIASLGVVVAPQEFDGAKIAEIVPGGIAEMASLRVGDLIKSVDGKPVKTPMELLAELSDKSGKVRIGILRGDVATETLVLLGR
jgi:hypothetical protein